MEGKSQIQPRKLIVQQTVQQATLPTTSPTIFPQSIITNMPTNIPIATQKPSTLITRTAAVQETILSTSMVAQFAVYGVVIAVVILIIVGIYVYWKRRQRKQELNSDLYDDMEKSEKSEYFVNPGDAKVLSNQINFNTVYVMN